MDLTTYKLKELKEMYPEQQFKFGTSKKDFIKQIEEAKNKPAEGLGDTIEKVMKATGVKKVVELFTNGKDCGCDERKKVLNKLFPYNKPNCMNEEQYNAWSIAGKEIQKTQKVTPEQQTLIITLLREVLNLSIHNDNCKSCSGDIWKKYIDMINKVADTYKVESE